MSSLRLFLFPDICPEEDLCLQTCLSELKKTNHIEEVKVSQKEKGFFKKNQITETSWVVSRDWQRALEFLAASSAKSKVIVSVLSTYPKKVSLWESWFQSVSRIFPAHIKLLAHSPLSYRFLRELVGVPDIQIEEIPFPIPNPIAKKKGSPFTVGAYCSFDLNSNLHFLLTVGHYLAQKDSSIHLNLWGAGPLSDHLKRLAKDLGISEQVQIIPTTSFSASHVCDVALYFPQRNDHFAPLLIAASVGAVPVCGNILGISDYVRDSVNGFIFELDETRSIAELLITLKNHPELCKQLGARFQQDMFEVYSSNQICSKLLRVLSGVNYQTQNYSRHNL